MAPVTLSVVSYLNTLPFIYGLKHSHYLNGSVAYSLDIPSVCAQKLKAGQVDIGLVPVALLPELPQYYVISDYCIGAVGNVKSVALYSQVPLEQIETVLLDYQSRTSVALVQVLAREFWKVQPTFVNATQGFEQQISGTTAAVVIGDRTFAMNGHYPYKYDLAGEWQKFTGLPFVFAVWASTRPVEAEWAENFNKTLAAGLANIPEAAKLGQGSGVGEAEIADYLQRYISYPLDEAKKEALKRFLLYL